MKLSTRTPSGEGPPGVQGVARVDRRTRSLLARVRPGDIAVIDETDLDRDTAQALVDAEVVAVVNVSPFFSGRYPSLGAGVLAGAGVMLVEGVGSEAVSQVFDGAAARIASGTLCVGKKAYDGTELDETAVEQRMQDARSGLATQLESFTANTAEFLRREEDLLLHGLEAPKLRTSMVGRPVVVVSRGYDHREDLARLKRFIRDQHPVLIGVDGGAETLVDARLTPDVLVVGDAGLGRQSAQGGSDDTGSVSDRTLRRARDVVLHADRSGHAPGESRLQRLGVGHHTMAASGTAEDIALIVADLGEASIIVTVGSHATLEEFLDRQRSGLASIFLTRLKVGAKLVEARAVPELYVGRVRAWQLLLVLLAGLVALVVAVASTPVGSVCGAGPPRRHHRADRRTVVVISFRYHVVTLVSVFLALAIGIALGGGPLRGEVDDGLVQQVQTDRERKNELSLRIDDLRSAARFTDSFAASVSPDLIDEVLADRSVAIVQLPGAVDATVGDLGDLVQTAGGEVAGTYRVSKALLDPDQKQLVDELGRQLARSARGVSVPRDASAYARMGALIGRAVGASGGPAEADVASGAILSGLSTADLFTSQGDPVGRADLVLVLTGSGNGPSADSSGAGDILASMLPAVREATDGLVVAGPTSAAGEGGVLSALLADANASRDISTVDSVELVTGQVVTVLALAEQAAGETGHYGGVDAADGALPVVPTG